MNTGTDKTNELSGSARTSLNILDYIFFLRPMLHPQLWTILLLGYFRFPSETLPIYRLIWIMILSSCAAGCAYVINQIVDIESDRINNKLFFLPYGIISKKAAYVTAAIMASAAIIGGFIFNWLVGILFLIGMGLGYVYSCRPFYGKKGPIASTLLNGLAYGILPFIAGFIGSGGLLSQGLILSIPYFFAVVAVFIGNTIPDMESDLRTGKITPAVKIGDQYSVVAMTISLMAAIFAAMLVRDITFLIAANLSMPLYLIAVIKPIPNRTSLAVKASIIFLSIAAAWKFWPYAIVLIVLIAATRLYYKMRFSMTYPRLT